MWATNRGCERNPTPSWSFRPAPDTKRIVNFPFPPSGVKVDYIKAILTVADPNYRYHEELKKTDTKLLNLEVI